MQEQNGYLEQALAECEDDRNMRAYLLAKMAVNDAVAAVWHLPDAEKRALSALEDATEPRVERYALSAVAWTRALTGRPVDDLCERSRVAEDPAAYVSATPERVAGMRLIWRGELGDARALFSSLSALTDKRGEPTSYAMVRLHRCELALRAGDLNNASLLLDEWSESSDFDTQFRPQYQRSRALLAAGRGDVGDTKRWAAEAIERARAVNCRWDELEALRARAMAAQLEQTPEQAVEDLRGVWEHCDREGVLDPGAFPVGPDLVEALVELGEVAPARKATKRLGELARKQDHPWGKASEKRCRGLVLLALDQHDEAGAALLEDATGDFERLELRFDAARCQLALGRALRRAKRWRGAREGLEAAITGFAALGSNGWADRARAELARVGARRPRTVVDELTPSEQQVAELAAEGLPNKQIASTLYVTVNTVEVHLAHAYAKLGVHSRSHLAKALSARS
jgi:DNA-binding CsgD family transcriptional regulator